MSRHRICLGLNQDQRNHVVRWPSSLPLSVVLGILLFSQSSDLIRSFPFGIHMISQSQILAPDPWDNRDTTTSKHLLTLSVSVLPPPPPRYTIPVAYAAGAANGMAVPVVETNNTISHPESGCPLQVGEGMCITSYSKPLNRFNGQYHACIPLRQC